MSKTMSKITKANAITAYKAFNSDWSCRGFQYVVGETYSHQGEIEACASGFHACLKPADVFSYYEFNPENKVAVVEVWGATDTHDQDSKIAAEKIKVVRELSWHEVLDLVNLGKGNTGLKNSGNRNSGNWNSGNGNNGNWNSGDGNSGNRNSGNRNSGNGNNGNWNSGNGNSGNRNSGNGNSGDGNSGDGNSGNRNSGNRNSGDGNSGDWNSGDWNSGDWNSGNGNKRFFCSGSQSLYVFDEPTDLSIESLYSRMPAFWNYSTCVWVDASAMSAAEKESNPNHETVGGYLKQFSYQEMCAAGWERDSDENKVRFFNLPNFTLKKFEKLTGIDGLADYQRLVKGAQ